MSGFARHLPLSQREPADESGVSSDRRAAIADVVTRAAELLAASRTPADAVTRFLDDAGLLADDASPDAPAAARLQAVAAAVRAGRRRRIRALSRSVRALLLVARQTGHDSRLDPTVAGAVALYAAGTAPADRRAVVRGHTVRADDADWSFGHGPVLAGRAADIAAFLLGVSDDPPRPPATAP